MDKHRELNIATPAGKPGHLSAASGVVKVGNRVFVIADDNCNLAEFSLDSPNQPGLLHRLLPEGGGDIAEDSTLIPEFESLIYLPPECIAPSGALLAVPSGSSSEKCSGALVPLSESGQPGVPKKVDFSSLYASIAGKIGSLNIEGAVCGPTKAYFFQRGNDAGSRNAIVEIHRDRFIDCLRYFSSVESITLSSIIDCELGDIGGSKLGFTDAASLADGRIVFTAAAEETGNCKGFSIGLMGSDLQIRTQKKFDKGPKVEGIYAESLTPPMLWMVFDNANPELPSSLYTMALE